jgi:integrase
MAKTHKKTGIANTLPGTIYDRHGRYWYKAQLPGEAKPVARPLVPLGSKYATTDYCAAVELAKDLYHQAIFKSQKTDLTISTVAELANAYLNYVRKYYVDAQGNMTQEPANIEYALKPLIELYPAISIESFGPLMLKNVREKMIQSDWSRKVINKRIGHIRRMFKWAVSEQIIPAMVLFSLQSIEGLKRGRCSARETGRILPVEEKHVLAVLPYMPKTLADMIQLQMLTGMRPGELVIMRPGDIDRSGTVWHYSPYRYKTQHIDNPDMVRIISIGPKAQIILTPYLLRGLEQYCFTPKESEEKRRAQMSDLRKTPLNSGNRPGTNKKDNPVRTPGDCYDVKVYAKAVRRAIKNAQDDGVKVPHWTLYQLRHTAATKVRREMGYETAGATLGHTNMSATAIYAERNQGLADEAARRLG